MQRRHEDADVSWRGQRRSYAELYRTLVPEKAVAESLIKADCHTCPSQRSPTNGPEPPACGRRSRFSAEELRREFHPVDLRRGSKDKRQDAGDRRRRPLLQRRSDPAGDPHGGRQRLWPGDRRAGRPSVDARRLQRSSASHGAFGGHGSLGQPQSRRTGRGFRHQVQYRQRRPGAERITERSSPAPRRIDRLPDRRDATTSIWTRSARTSAAG